MDLCNGLGTLENVLGLPASLAHVDGVEQHEVHTRRKTLHVHDLLDALEVHVDHLGTSLS